VHLLDPVGVGQFLLHCADRSGAMMVADPDPVLR